MHYHLEIVLPPTADVEAAVRQILEPFNENCEDEEIRSSHSFWDWHVIGGRWSGAKIEARIGAERMAEFTALLNEKKFTVSGLQWGKQELSPASQTAEVDALWREQFPDSAITTCPLFKHAGDRLPLDVCRLDELPDSLNASRVIVAGPTHDGSGLEAKSMTQTEVWNGVSLIDTTWNGNVSQALKDHAAQIERYTDEYRVKYTPASDWLVVTVDYHS